MSTSRDFCPPPARSLPRSSRKNTPSGSAAVTDARYPYLVQQHQPPGRDRRRAFRRSDVRRAWELQGRRCKLCSRAIPADLMHGDHIHPWTDGGPTTLANLQALCGSCNLRKGSRPQKVIARTFNTSLCAPGTSPLRRWQVQALAVTHQELGQGPVLVEACPGAGKTMFGLTLAYELLAAHRVSRVLIVAPTLGILDGWLRAASAAMPGAPTLPLRDPRDWRPVDPIGEAWAGCVLTYQALFSMPDVFLAHATDPGHQTLVIFDEVHHAGTDSGWGHAAQSAFSNAAAAVLSLSGTPFRTDKTPIAFVPAHAGVAMPHYRYSYSDALIDGACRPVQFVEARGHTTFRTEDGRTHEVSFDETDVTDRGARYRLRAALEWIEPESIADKMLRDANAYLAALRASGDHDAAGLVVCVDCDHADRVADHMARHVLRARPVIACSRLNDQADPDPADTIRRFSQGQEPWIVAVNMVSEGVDIRRFRVVVYLTNRMTTLSFRQIVGRVVRSDPSNENDVGRVYLPAEPRLLEMAREILNEVRHLPPLMVIDMDAPSGNPVVIRGEPRPRQAFEVLATAGEQGAVFDTSGNKAEADLVARARQFIQQHGLTGTDPESLALLARAKPLLLVQLLACKPVR